MNDHISSFGGLDLDVGHATGARRAVRRAAPRLAELCGTLRGRNVISRHARRPRMRAAAAARQRAMMRVATGAALPRARARAPRGV
jgi:hypothetical protein